MSVGRGLNNLFSNIKYILKKTFKRQKLLLNQSHVRKVLYGTQAALTDNRDVLFADNVANLFPCNINNALVDKVANYLPNKLVTFPDNDCWLGLFPFVLKSCVLFS